jgi:ABC-type Mn2+/Zn2+ transport system permease subunit
MSDWLQQISQPFVQRALIGIVLIGVNAALSGVFASFRSLTFLVSGASHAALAGAALVIVLETFGILHGLSPILGGVVFAVALALLAARATFHGSERSADPAVGAGFAFSMALAVVLIALVPQAATRVWGVLLGDLLLLSVEDLWLLSALTLVVSVAFWMLWRQFLFVTFDIEGARAFGINAEVYNTVLFALIGLSSAIIMKGVGAIVVFAMLVSPAATAMLFASSVRKVALWSFAIAVASGLLALALSFRTGNTVSGLAALLAAGSYFVAKGWLWLAGRHSRRALGTKGDRHHSPPAGAGP